MLTSTAFSGLRFTPVPEVASEPDAFAFATCA